MTGVFNILKKSVSVITLSSIIIFLVITGSGEQKAWSQLVLDLRPIPSSIEEGQMLEFSGSIAIEGQPLPALTIVIKDAITGQVIGTVESDSNGEFHFNWIAVYQNGPYAFFAELVTTDAVSARSATYEVTVTHAIGEEVPPAPESRTDSDAEVNSNTASEETRTTTETSSEFEGEANYINLDLFLLIIVLVGVTAAYVIHKSRRHTTRPSIEIRGGLD